MVRSAECRYDFSKSKTLDHRYNRRDFRHCRTLAPAEADPGQWGGCRLWKKRTERNQKIFRVTQVFPLFAFHKHISLAAGHQRWQPRDADEVV